MLKRCVFYPIALVYLILFLPSYVEATNRIQSVSIELKDSRWAMQSEPIDVKDKGTLFYELLNQKTSSENMIYRIYKDGSQTAFFTKEVGPGMMESGSIEVTEAGRYYITLGCGQRPGIYYTLPPCKGTAYSSL